MKNPCRDVRVWLPVTLAAAAFLPRLSPPPPGAAPAGVPALALPAVHGVAAPKVATSYELDAEASSVRFLVRGDRGELLVSCPGLHGSLQLDAGGHTGRLELRCDLGSLRVLEPQGDLDVQHVLGVHRNELVYRAQLVADATSDLPGVGRQIWLGTLTFGTRLRRQPIETWCCRLPARSLRLSGHGTVDAETLGLPTRRWFGIVAEHNEVTMGLDLAWRRRRD